MPLPIQFPSPIDISFLGIPQPNCSLLPLRGAHFDGGVIFPGVYESITVNTGSLTMKPGPYCVTGEVEFLGGEVLAYGVTIYVEGDFTTTSSVDVRLNAPQKRVLLRQGIIDVLLYLGEGSHATLYNKGASSFKGVVYGPDSSSEIALFGGGTIYSQLVVHKVSFHNAGYYLQLVLDPLHAYPKEALDEFVEP